MSGVSRGAGPCSTRSSYPTPTSAATSAGPRPLARFLDAVRRGDLATRRLILNGDVFDSFDFRRLNKHHWKVLSMLRKLSDTVETTWINGNHDGPADAVSHLLGVAVEDEIVLETGGKRVLCLHGHRFDAFIERYPVTSKLADLAYRGLQWLDKSHTVARTAKRSSKTFLRCVAKVEAASRQYAAEKGCDAVCCGHTHAPAALRGGPADYFNSGSWTENPAHYLAVHAGAVELVPVADEPASGTAGRFGSMNSQTMTPSA